MSRIPDFSAIDFAPTPVTAAFTLSAERIFSHHEGTGNTS